MVRLSLPSLPATLVAALARRGPAHLCADALDDGLGGAGLPVDELLDNHDSAAARVRPALRRVAGGAVCWCVCAREGGEKGIWDPTTPIPGALSAQVGQSSVPC